MDDFDHGVMDHPVWDGDAYDRVHVSHIGGIRSYAYGDHDHRGFWELTLVRTGVLHQRLGGEWRAQEAGTATLLREDEVHALRGERVEYVNVSFDTGFVRRLDPAVRAALRAPGPLTVRLPEARRIQAEADCEALAAASGPLQAALLVQLLCVVAAQALQREASPVDGPPWLARLRERVAEDPSRPVPGLRQLRAWAGVAPEHLARTVRRHLGCTPTQWLHQLRLERGARLLAATDLPVATVAARCGYADPGLFHRRFRAVRGLGPRDYRAREQRFVR